MRKKISLFFVFFILPAIALAAYPKPQGFVSDFAGVISSPTRNGLERMLSSFEQSSGIEVAVVTLSSLEGAEIEDVAPKLFKEWGIGKKDKNNGALFLIAPKERRTRIEVGYGLEGTINDALAGRILDTYVIPRFRDGDTDSGIQAGTVALVKTIATKEGISFNAAIAATSDVPAPASKSKKPIPIAFKIIGFLVLAYLFIRHPWLFFLVLSMSGRGGGGGSSGGFGGFGGGFSGGGGSSRSW